MLEWVKFAVPSLLLMSLAGCASNRAGNSTVRTGENSHPAKDTAQSEELANGSKVTDTEKERAEKILKRAKLGRDAAIAREEVARAKVAIDNQRANNTDAFDRAQVEYELAKKKLDDFEAKHKPARLQRARNDLQGNKDNLKEAEEELAQLEMMYNEADLADKTREIVIERAKRRLERTRRALTQQQQELDNLEQATLPLEAAELRSQLRQKEQAVQAARRSAEADLRSRQLEVMKSEAEAARLDAEIAELDKESTP